MIAALLVLAATPAEAAALKPFVQLAGSCWVANFSPTVRDTHCYELMYGGAHIRDRHEVTDNGKTVYGGETIYSRAGSETVFTYVNSLGGVGTGTVVSEGAMLRFRGSMRPSPAEQPQVIDSEWKILDDDHYDVRSLAQSDSTGGNPVLHFTRQPK